MAGEVADRWENETRLKACVGGWPAKEVALTLRRFVFLFLAGLALAACARSVPAPVDYRITAVIERALRDDASRRADLSQRQARRELGDGPIYTVRSGDTLGEIADRYGVRVVDIIRLNGLANPDRIFVGQPLMLPDAARVQTAFVDPATRRERSSVVVDETAIPKTPATKPVETTQTARATPPPPVPRARVLPRARASRGFDWPVQGRVLQTFGPQGNGRVNDGINIAAAPGAPVRAAADGEVIYVGEEVKNLGNLLLIRHADGWITAYAHTQAVAVRRGDQVSQGQPIAQVGRSNGASQVHFELRRGTEPVDPLTRLPQLTS
ncbi:MAG: M23 family metallopeptidase [Alphaproteobacteria bacterium]